MKNVIQNIKNSKGFVSLESILVIGVIIVLAGVILFFFNAEAKAVTAKSKEQTTSGKSNQNLAGTMTITPVVPPVTP